MKSVLISIQPKWCELIANGKKTIEVRKTAPKLEAPFKCYIYATKPKKFIKGYADDDLFRHVDGRIECGFSYQLVLEEGATIENNILSGKVIGEFLCDQIIKYKGGVDYGVTKDGRVFYCGTLAECTGLTRAECLDYGKKKILCGYELQTLYGWHISGLKIYDTPKKLSEFRKPCKWEEKEEPDCFICSKSGYTPDMQIDCFNTVEKPPQSWRYVEG